MAAVVRRPGETKTSRRCCPRASCGTRSCARPTPMPSRASSSSTASTAATISGIARRSARPIPCLTADTWIQTSEGPRQIARAGRTAIRGRSPTARHGGATRAASSRPAASPPCRCERREGYALRLTPDHRLRRITRRTRWSTEWEWCAASELRPGDELLLHDHRNAPAWGDPEAAERDAAEGYLLGLLIGDGTLKRDKAVLVGLAWTARC